MSRSSDIKTGSNFGMVAVAMALTQNNIAGSYSRSLAEIGGVEQHSLSGCDRPCPLDREQDTLDGIQRYARIR